MDARSTPLRRAAAGSLLIAIPLLIAGCSLVIGGIRTFMGDPMLDSSFKRKTNVDLAGEGKTVVVLCSVPNAISSHYPSVSRDVLSGVTRNLKRETIKVVDDNRVLDWIDTHGFPEGREDIARADFTEKADYVIHVELQEFTHRADKSPDMFQGRVVGMVHAYKIIDVDDRRDAAEVFTSEIRLVHPKYNPISASQMKGEAFQRKFVKRLTTRLAEMFYDHRAAMEVR
ncbi:MAG: hypothetical protein ACE5KM_18535 [Planctomycetaceae bacterium]